MTADDTDDRFFVDRSKHQHGGTMVEEVGYWQIIDDFFLAQRQVEEQQRPVEEQQRQVEEQQKQVEEQQRQVEEQHERWTGGLL